MFRNIPLTVKLFSLLFIPLALVAISNYLLLQLNDDNTQNLTSSLYDTTGRATALILNADRDMYQALVAVQVLSNSSDAQEREKEYSDFEENVLQANERVAQATEIIYEKQLDQLQHKETGRTIVQIVGDYQLYFDDWTKDARQIYANPSLVENKQTEFFEKFSKGREGLNEYGEILDTYALDQVEKIQLMNKNSKVAVYAILIALIVILAFAGYLIIRQIRSAVQNVLNRTKRVAEGDLTTPLLTNYAKDELGQLSQAVDTMIIKMRDLISKISVNTDHINNAWQDLSVSSEESATAANHVALNIQEVTSDIGALAQIADESNRAIGEMTIGVQRIAENSSVISEYSSNTATQADQGNDILQNLQQQMTDIFSSIDGLSQIIHSLNQRSEKIGSIVVNITEFANQTNLLSLNASIEAARAGEQGKGFAVVATEIRKLATNSLQSADVIHQLISETQEDITSASTSMDRTLLEADRGQNLMSEVNTSFNDILHSVNEMVTQIHEISAVTEQLSASSEEISASMEQNSSTTNQVSDRTQNVAAATEQQLALVENISYSAEQLRGILDDLNKSVSNFKL